MWNYSIWCENNGNIFIGLFLFVYYKITDTLQWNRTTMKQFTGKRWWFHYNVVFFCSFVETNYMDWTSPCELMILGGVVKHNVDPDSKRGYTVTQSAKIPSLTPGLNTGWSDECNHSQCLFSSDFLYIYTPDIWMDVVFQSLLCDCRPSHTVSAGWRGRYAEYRICSSAACWGCLWQCSAVCVTL